MEEKYTIYEKLVDDSPYVLNHPQIKPLYEKLCNLAPVLTRQDWLHSQIGWIYGLRNHPDHTYVRDLLHKNTHGWTITSQTINCNGAASNYRCTIPEIKAGLEKLLKLLKAGRFLGPFKSLEEARAFFKDDDLKIWPIFFKQEGTKHRLLINLSFNKHLGTAFNNCISEEEKHVEYLKIKQIIKWIIKANIKYLWSIDAWRAYYSVPIKPEFTPKLGIKLCGLFFFFTTILMGLASSCNLYTEFAAAINWIVINNSELFTTSDIHSKPIELLMSYMDDFIGGATNLRWAWTQLDEILWWWHILGVPTQLKKIIYPNEWIVYIGYVFDCKLKQLRVPLIRLDKYIQNLYDLINDMRSALVAFNIEQLPLKLMQSVVGECRSIQIVYPYTIPFLRSTEDLINIPGKIINGRWKYDTNWVAPNKLALNDLEYVYSIYTTPSANKMRFDWLLCMESDCDITVFTDAATTEGVGGWIDINNGGWFGEKWSKFEQLTHFNHTPDITFFELAGVVIAAELFSEQLRNKKVLFRCDNEAACWISIKKSACLNRPDLTALMKIFCDLAYRLNMRIYAKHIAGIDNDTADGLSRIYKLIGKPKDYLANTISNADDQINRCLAAWREQERYLTKLKNNDDFGDDKFVKKFPDCDCKTVNQLAVCEKIRLDPSYLL